MCVNRTLYHWEVAGKRPLNLETLNFLRILNTVYQTMEVLQTQPITIDKMDVNEEVYIIENQKVRFLVVLFAMHHVMYMYMYSTVHACVHAYMYSHVTYCTVCHVRTCTVQ